MAEAKRQTRAQTSNGVRPKRHRFEKFEHLLELTEDSKPLKSYEPPFDIKAYKQKFLKGQDYNITEFMEVKKGPNAIKRSIMKDDYVKKTKVEAKPKR